jgi:hypothetical protein
MVSIVNDIMHKPAPLISRASVSEANAKGIIPSQIDERGKYPTHHDHASQPHDDSRCCSQHI